MRKTSQRVRVAAKGPPTKSGIFSAALSQQLILAVLKMIFDFVLGPRSPGGPGRGSGLSSSIGNGGFWADSGPDPGG